MCEFASTEENVTKHVEVTKAKAGDKSKKSKSKSKGQKRETKAGRFKSWRQKLDALKAGDESWMLSKAGA